MPRVEAEESEERRELARAQTLQEGMDCRERDMKWSRVGTEEAEVSRKFAGAYM